MSNGFSALVLLEIKSAETLESESVETVGLTIEWHGTAGETAVALAVARAGLECASLYC